MGGLAAVTSSRNVCPKWCASQLLEWRDYVGPASVPGQPGGPTRIRGVERLDTYLPLPEDADPERRDESCKGKLLVALEDLVLDALEGFGVSGREWRKDERGGVLSA